MNLSTFEKSFYSLILNRGKTYHNLKKVRSIENISENKYNIMVSGTKNYIVSIEIEDNEEITQLSCTCPYGSHCKHEVAALYELRNIISKENDISTFIIKKNGFVINDLIDKYSRKNKKITDIEENLNSIHLFPAISKKWDHISLDLKAGAKNKKRSYVISNIPEFSQMFKSGTKHRYGKDLEFIHSYNVLDEESEKLIQFIRVVSEQYTNKYSYNKKFLSLNDEQFPEFLKIYVNKEISFENNLYRVSLQNYPINFKLEKKENNIYSMSVSQDYQILSSGTESTICDHNNKIIYICTADYSEAMTEILKTIENNNNKIFIPENDIMAFYKNILFIISEFSVIENIDIISHIKPPELKALLYLDMPEKNTVTAKLVFSYNDKEFNPYSYYDNPLADIKKETIIKNKAEKYFTPTNSKNKYNLLLCGDKEIYHFITEGLAELSEKVEILASENFDKISVFKKISLNIGVHIKSNLLELEFDTGNYSIDELSDILASYNKGLKYHRLDSGEFINLDDEILNEFSELKNALNISDNELITGKTNIPKYRMLYLDALRKNNKELNIDESKEFYKEIKKYKTLSEVGDFNFPNKLEDIMREYQKDGFCWFKTIHTYNFGGILADDMGLGKTLQAISLMQSIKDENPDKKFLVVCPASLVLNWESEIKKFAPDLKSLSLVGTVSERTEKIKKISEHDIIITSYNLLIKDIKSYKKLEFCIHFVDEAQYIKNHNTQAAKATKLIKSETRFALTGTPIENSLAELWSIFDFIMPGYLYDYRYFKNNFETPIVKSKDINKTKALQKIVAPFILRRMKKEVLKELPDKTETILKSEMDDIQRKLYIANLVEFKKSAKEKTAAEGEKSRFEVLAMLTKLRQLCCDPKLIYDDYDGESAKLEQCIELVSNCVDAGHKILLFSQFTSMLDIIQKRLDEYNISTYMLTGKTKPSERLNMVNKFNKDSTNVFLISLKAGGTGLNLTGADIVIHYDPWWNISAENQASDRAYRIGQRKNVQIYKLISENTIEEKIHILQQAKSELTEITNSTENITQMSLSDILDLFE